MADAYLKIRHAKRQNAQNLDISSMSLNNVPEDVFALKTLLHLNLSKNNLITIEKTIENMKNLVELNLEGNKIVFLPIELTSLPNLKIVKICDNPIAKNLVDWNLNWKESLKDFHKIKSETSLNDESSNNQVNLGKKVPFNFNMSKSKLNFMNNTFTSLHKKESPTGEIPKCVIFDRPSEAKILMNLSNSTLPVRIQSGNINKREALNTIIKSKSIIKVDTQNIINENSTHQTIPSPTENSTQELKSKLTKYEEEIKHLKSLQKKAEDDNIIIIKNLEDEIKKLKCHKNPNESLKTEEKKTLINNKRNWMEEDLPSGIIN